MKCFVCLFFVSMFVLHSQLRLFVMKSVLRQSLLCYCSVATGLCNKC